MATSFAPRPQYINYNQQYVQQRSANTPATYTPPSPVTLPSANVSPTSVTLPAKQIHPVRHCGYIPAALRPTRPISPPRSAHSSIDSQTSQTSLGSQPLTPIDDYSAFIAPLGQVNRVITDEWNEELGEVTGQISRGHWQPDKSVTCCTSPTCATVFSLLARRHHCRRCGRIYCTSHSTRVVPLDQDARFHPQGTFGRSCDDCFNDYLIWQYDRKSRASSINSAGTITPPAIDDSKPIRGSDYIGIKPRQGSTTHRGPRNESLRDADWNWSTF